MQQYNYTLFAERTQLIRIFTAFQWVRSAITIISPTMRLLIFEHAEKWWNAQKKTNFGSHPVMFSWRINYN
jgi:hypothetical protein